MLRNERSGSGRGRRPKRVEEPEQLNIARLLYIGTTKLGYSESEIFDMTPRKFFRIFDEYKIMNGMVKKEQTIDDLP